MSRPPLRCGLLLDTETVPWWLAQGIERCQREGTLDVVVALVCSPIPPSTDSRWTRYWSNRALLAGRLALRIDRSRRRGHPPPPDRPLASLAPDCRVVPVTPTRGRFTDEIPDNDLRALADAEVSLLIREGFRILKGAILTAAPMGILSFHHGDNRVNRGGPTGVWEVLNGEPTSGLTLQIMSAELDGGTVLARSVGRTDPYSFDANRQAIFARSPAVMARTVKRLWCGESGVHGSATADPAWSGFEHGILRFPENAAAISGVRGLLSRRARFHRQWRGRTHQWSIAWQFARHDTGGVPDQSLRRYRVWPSPPGIFRADPFPVLGEDDRHWLFFEEYDYRERVGKLRVVEWGQAGPIGEPMPVLDESYHLSYPNVFAHQGNWYLLPEAAAGGHVDLYQAETFPNGWRHVRRLLTDVPLIDPTLLEHRGAWYLFGNLTDDGIGPDDELHLFVGQTPFGPFVPHPGSPVVTDVREARMAGRFFRTGGELYRPAQIGAPRYGSGVSMQRVEQLDAGTYRESTIQRLLPSWDADAIGFHTLNAAGRLSVLDLRRLVPRGTGQP